MRSTSNERSKRSDDSRDIHFHTQLGLWPAAATSMTDEEIAALLASPVGRGMVEAAVIAFDTMDGKLQVLPHRHAMVERQITPALKASLRVATDTTCPTCGGKGQRRGTLKGTCMNCKDGKVPPPILALLGIETREQVVADIVKAIRDREDHKHRSAVEAESRRIAGFIVRRERER